MVEPLTPKLSEISSPNVRTDNSISNKKVVIWTSERKEKMREIKSKLRLSDEGQFGIHVETWSKGKLRSISEITSTDADEFIKYMYDKYINRINDGGLDDPGVGSDAVQGDLF
jgi:hypothetical protein